MLFNSYVFILGFLPVTAIAFYALGSRGHIRAALTLLVLASFFFYGWWNPAYLILIGGSILFNYAAGRELARRHAAGISAYWLLVLACAANLLLIGYYKYAGFFVENVEALTGRDYGFEGLVLPLAISFFTFQQIAYLVDAARGETAEYNFLHYCLFVTFFPQLIAGPIVHHREMLPQFARAAIYRPQALRIAVGLSIFILGLAKKVLIADRMAEFATPVFHAADSGMTITFLDAWMGALTYTFQLYFDFSGYSDMAIGLARIFGIRLPLNFNAPYKATGIIEFWRRWHMTLSRFLRDYLYIPLGGGRVSPVRRQINLMITMLLGGLWHGASWNFVLWGGLHGVYLVINHLWRRLTGRPRFGWIGRRVSVLVTFLAVVFAWVLFRAETLAGAGRIFAGMTGQNGIAFNIRYLGKFNRMDGLGDWLATQGVRFADDTIHAGSQALNWIAIGLILSWAAPTTQQIFRRFRPALHTYGEAIGNRLPRLLSWRPSIPWSVAMAVVALLCLFRLMAHSEFLYYQF
ncbi:MAG: MBOAT family protein [Flavobacteriaceae bacterium]